MLLKEAKEILKKNGYIVEASRWSPFYIKRETKKPEWYGKRKCEICGEPATHRVYMPYHHGEYDNYGYYCDACAKEQTMEESTIFENAEWRNYILDVRTILTDEYNLTQGQANILTMKDEMFDIDDLPAEKMAKLLFKKYVTKEGSLTKIK